MDHRLARKLLATFRTVQLGLGVILENVAHIALD